MTYWYLRLILWLLTEIIALLAMGYIIVMYIHQKKKYDPDEKKWIGAVSRLGAMTAAALLAIACKDAYRIHQTAAVTTASVETDSDVAVNYETLVWSDTMWDRISERLHQDDPNITKEEYRQMIHASEHGQTVTVSANAETKEKSVRLANLTMDALAGIADDMDELTSFHVSSYAASGD